MLKWGASGAMVIVQGNRHVTWFQNLNEAVYILHSANTLGEWMNLIIFPQPMDKY